VSVCLSVTDVDECSSVPSEEDQAMAIGYITCTEDLVKF